MAGPNYGLLDNALVNKNRAVEGYGAVNQLVAQNLENQVAKMGIENALAEKAAYEQAGGDVTQAQKNLMAVGQGKQSVALGKAVAETEQAKMKVLSERLPTIREMAKDMAFNPSDQNIQAHLQDQLLKGWITPEEAQNRWSAVAKMNPEQRKNHFLQGATKAEDLIQIEEQRRHNRTTEGISAGHLALAQKEFNLKQQEKGPVGQELKDVNANLKALRTAGYDPETGVDKVSELIKKSTSGMGESLTAGAYGAVTGGTTSGMKAIGQLDTISKTMTLDLLNNKLGAGISNADRDALEARFGSIANPNLPADQRLAAWNEAKNIMRKAAMLPEAKGAATGGKDGVDTSNPLLK